MSVALPAFVAGFEAIPSISRSSEAVVHMKSTTALQIGTAGPTVASPSSSMWQTDCYALKVTLAARWNLRTTANAAVATVSAVNW